MVRSAIRLQVTRHFRRDLGRGSGLRLAGLLLADVLENGANHIQRMRLPLGLRGRDLPRRFVELVVVRSVARRRLGGGGKLRHQLRDADDLALRLHLLGDLDTRRLRRHQGRLGIAHELARRPLLGLAAGDPGHIGARLAGQPAALGHPIAHPPGTGVVGRRRQAEIAELRLQPAQEFPRGVQRVDRLERIDQPVFVRGLRHELGDAQRSRAADRLHVEVALLPDQVGEERNRQVVGARHRRPRRCTCCCATIRAAGRSGRPRAARAACRRRRPHRNRAPSVLTMRSITDGRQRRHRMADGIGEGGGGGHRGVGRRPRAPARRCTESAQTESSPLPMLNRAMQAPCEWAARSLCDFVLRRPHRPRQRQTWLAIRDHFVDEFSMRGHKKRTVS